ncbi:hypothetical protein SLS60_009845 [Paraconiothyrium brasiliense]|uniref:Poly(A) RNA polymerase mitochondrial-like central palm domain-containing protein n=1 Tax=Paraconiothyrium brasiliense TaxID=300254 RepID=A0ABR3QSM4_9PLEO
MKLQHARPVCRAPNRFSPSVLLYQHFIFPYNAAHQQRLSSSAPAPEAAEDGSPKSFPENQGAVTAEAEYKSPARPKIRLYEVSGIGKRQMRMDLAHNMQSRKIDHQKLGGKKGDLAWRAHVLENRLEALLLNARLAVDEGKEYKGALVRPLQSPVFVPEQKYPWAAKSSRANIDAMSRLNREINDFYEYAKPSRTELFARKNLVEQVRADVRQHLPNHILEVFGSERTGLALALSDIDLRLVKRDELNQNVSDKLPTSTERKRLLKILYDIRYQVFDGKNPSSTKYILPALRHSRYPLVSVQDKGSGLDVQVVSSNNTAGQRDFIQRYMKEYPYLRQTYAVIKTIFDQRGFSDVFRGGFGSYPLFMMIVASLQNQPNQRRDAAGALLNFLYYWAYFKTSEHGVSIAPPEYFDKKENPILTDSLKLKLSEGNFKPLPDYMLSLRDPADKTNDLGRKGSVILHVQSTLRYLTAHMIKTLNSNNTPSLLAPLVGEVYGRDRARREKLSAHGSWIQRRVEGALSARVGNSDATPAPETQQEGDVHSFLDNNIDKTATSQSKFSIAYKQPKEGGMSFTAPNETPTKEVTPADSPDDLQVQLKEVHETRTHGPP